MFYLTMCFLSSKQQILTNEAQFDKTVKFWIPVNALCTLCMYAYMYVRVRMYVYACTLWSSTYDRLPF
jgi:hypothetical protein